MNKAIKRSVYIFVIVALTLAYVFKNRNLPQSTPQIVQGKSQIEDRQQNAVANANITENIGQPAPASHQVMPATPPKQLLIIDDGMPHAIAVLAKLHPDLNLSDKDIAGLQRIYSWYCQEATVYETQIATIVALDKDTNVVNIPAYPDAAKSFKAQLLQAVSEYYQQEQQPLPENLITDLAAEFTDSDSLGVNPQTLTIHLANNPQYKYEVVRQITFIDPTTGTVQGQGKTVNQVNNPYPAQERFSP